MSGSILYHVPQPDGQWPEHFPNGVYRDENLLLDRLKAFTTSHALPSDLSIHVYRTFGIDRTHIGTINASSVLMAGEVDLEKVQA